MGPHPHRLSSLALARDVLPASYCFELRLAGPPAHGCRRSLSLATYYRHPTASSCVLRGHPLTAVVARSRWRRITGILLLRVASCGATRSRLSSLALAGDVLPASYCFELRLAGPPAPGCRRSLSLATYYRHPTASSCVLRGHPLPAVVARSRWRRITGILLLRVASCGATRSRLSS